MRRLGDSHGRVLFGGLLIGLGAVLFASRLLGLGMGLLLPLFMILPGLVLCAMAAIGGWHSKWLAVLGAVSAGTGAILLVQDSFGYFRSWAYAWALIPFFAGAGLAWFGREHEGAVAVANGLSLMQWSLVAFVVLALAFELLVFEGHLSAARGIVALALVVAGGALLFGSRLRHAERARR